MPKYKIVATYKLTVEETVEAASQQLAFLRRTPLEVAHDGDEWEALANAEMSNVTICEEVEDDA